jgi:hypothetical protein
VKIKNNRKDAGWKYGYDPVSFQDSPNNEMLFCKTQAGMLTKSWRACIASCCLPDVPCDPIAPWHNPQRRTTTLGCTAQDEAGNKATDASPTPLEHLLSSMSGQWPV